MTATLPSEAVRDVAAGPALAAFAAERLPAVEAGLAQAVAGMTPPAPAYATALRDAVDVGGGQAHRWRPLVILAAADACGADPGAALEIAVAVELTHTASLVLDDLPCMDDAPLRRGRLSTHRQVGEAGAILLAVGLLGRAVEWLGRAPAGNAALAQAWGEAVGLPGMAGGQAMDLEHRAGRSLAGAPRRLYRRKTTALAAFSALSGGIVAEAPPAQLAALARYGDNLGWAYQLRDDAADLAEDGAAADGVELAGRKRARMARRATRALSRVAWRRPASAGLLAAAAWRIAGVPDELRGDPDGPWETSRC